MVTVVNVVSVSPVAPHPRPIQQMIQRQVHRGRQLAEEAVEALAQVEPGTRLVVPAEDLSACQLREARTRVAPAELRDPLRGVAAVRGGMITSCARRGVRPSRPWAAIAARAASSAAWRATQQIIIQPPDPTRRSP